MHSYGFIDYLQKNAFRVGQEKIKVFMGETVGSSNHSIKKVTMAEEEHDSYEEVKPLA